MAREGINFLEINRVKRLYAAGYTEEEIANMRNIELKCVKSHVAWAKKHDGLKRQGRAGRAEAAKGPSSALEPVDGKLPPELAGVESNLSD